jgi:putative transposase
MPYKLPRNNNSPGTGCRYPLHDRDRKFCQSFREVIESGNVKPIRLPARSPNLNSYAERWVRSVKEECLSKLILLGESSLRRALQQYMLHYHEERNHQGKENEILFPVWKGKKDIMIPMCSIT